LTDARGASEPRLADGGKPAPRLQTAICSGEVGRAPHGPPLRSLRRRRQSRRRNAADHLRWCRQLTPIPTTTAMEPGGVFRPPDAGDLRPSRRRQGVGPFTATRAPSPGPPTLTIAR
jgi:hypothetical protein